MNKGTKSLLFGVHQFIWHPIVVLLAWIELYGLPNWKELLCIIIHDWGYWGCENMDDEKGRRHTEFAANIIFKLFQFWQVKFETAIILYDLCLLHSRHYAKNANCKPSKLCYADKLSTKYEAQWFYLLRAKLTGELQEYMQHNVDNGEYTNIQTHPKKWFKDMRQVCISIGKAQDEKARDYE